MRMTAVGLISGGSYFYGLTYFVEIMWICIFYFMGLYILADSLLLQFTVCYTVTANRKTGAFE